jgi:membrane protein DedA with SNARE-associated domain
MFENIEGYAQQLVEFVRGHEAWAAPVVFALAFGESLAFLSLLIPAWAALVGIGALIGSSRLNFWPIWVAGSVGAALGDWLSYWMGIKIGPPVAHMWPLSRHPELLPRGEAFVRRWGVLAIFVGRFFGPLRASVPLVAGIFRMHYWQFQIANFTSAFVWVYALLTVGDIARAMIRSVWP